MKESSQTAKSEQYQSYIRLIRYLRKKQEGKKNETPDPKKTDCHKSE